MKSFFRRVVPALLIIPSFLAVTQTPAEAAGTTTFVTMVGEAGTWVGGNASRLWRPETGSVSVTGSVGTGIGVTVSGPSGSYYLTFAAPRGQDLTVGRYENAQRTPFRDDGLPGIDIDGEGAGCNTVSGSFEILDIAPDLSRLWLTYEHHCEGGDPALFGEIKFQMPDDDPSLLVAPSRIAWPDEYPTVSGRPVPVTLVNTGTSPVTVTDATISSGSTDFTMLDNACATLDVGATCAVYVGFAPSEPGDRLGTLQISDTTAAGSHTVALGGTGIAGRTAWQMQSDPGDWVGGGRTYSWDPTTATITGFGNDSTVGFSVTSGDDDFTATFAAGSGNLLLPGTTINATRYPNPGAPGMDISGDGRGCNTLTGSFTVDEAAYSDGRLERMKLSFEQHCEGGTAALRGTVWWHSNDGSPSSPPGDTTPPDQVGSVTAYPMIGSVVLSWADPTASDWSRTIVRMKAGTTPPASASSGSLVYEGRSGGSIVDGLAPGTPYSFRIFPVDTSGNIGPGVPITIGGADLRLGTSKHKIALGGRARVGGVLKDPTTGSALARQPVAFYRRVVGTGRWKLVEVLRTGADGRWSSRIAPRRDTEYRASFQGSRDHLGATAGPLLVRVSGPSQ